MLAGSADDITWAQIDAQDNLTWTPGDVSSREFPVSSNTGYKYIMFLVTRNGNADRTASRGATNVSELAYYGVESSTVPTVPTVPTSPTSPVATGGSSTNTYSAGGVSYKSHTFTSSSTFTVTSATDVAADVMVVGGGGGGGGGTGAGGGGGGGGVVTRTVTLKPNVTYTVTVSGSAAPNASGVASSIIGDAVAVTALGGGKGGASPGWYNSGAQ